MTPTQLFRAKSPANFKRFLAMGAHQFRPRPLSRDKRLLLEKKHFAKQKQGEGSQGGGVAGAGMVMQMREGSPRGGSVCKENLKQILQIDVKLNNSPRVLTEAESKEEEYKDRFGEIKSSILEIQES